MTRLQRLSVVTLLVICVAVGAYGFNAARSANERAGAGVSLLQDAQRENAALQRQLDAATATIDALRTDVSALRDQVVALGGTPPPATPVRLPPTGSRPEPSPTTTTTEPPSTTTPPSPSTICVLIVCTRDAEHRPFQPPGRTK